MRLFKYMFLAVLLSSYAHTGEKPLGTLLIGAATTVRNYDTLTPFVIAPGSRITIQCNAITFIVIDSGNNVAATGVKLAADQLYDTSVGTRDLVVISGKKSGIVSGFSTPGGLCNVWERRGNERFGQ